MRRILRLGLIAGTVLTMSTGLRAQDLIASQKQAVDRYVAAEMAREHIPGATVGVYRHGKMVYGQGYGFADLEWQVKTTPDTLFQTGSIGKQFLATAIMMLVEQGKVGLDDPIRRYFPEGLAGWTDAPVELLSREQHDDVLVSRYRIGPANDRRDVLLVTGPNGMIRNFRIMPDPDNR